MGQRQEGQAPKTRDGGGFRPAGGRRGPSITGGKVHPPLLLILFGFAPEIISNLYIGTKIIQMKHNKFELFSDHSLREFARP